MATLCQTKPKPTQNHTHAPSAKTSRVTVAISDRPGHKQLLKTPASLNCTTAVGYSVWEEPLPRLTSLNLSYFSVHGVAFSDVPLVPERLGTLTPASTGIEENHLFHRAL